MLKWRRRVRETPPTLSPRDEAIKCLVRAAQLDRYKPILTALSLGKDLPKRNPLALLPSSRCRRYSQSRRMLS